MGRLFVQTLSTQHNTDSSEMFTAEEVYDFCRDRVGLLPKDAEYEHLYGVFSELSRDDIALLFNNIESGAEILPRLLSALDVNPPEIDTRSTLHAFVSAFRCVMGQFLEEPDRDRWNSLRVEDTIEEDDEDLIYTVYDTFADWIADGAPASDHPIEMLREAFYSIKADYMVMYHITWPLNARRREVTLNPLEPLFALAVRNHRLGFQGNRIGLLNGPKQRSIR